MKLALMQPYFFPYLGYFQLIASVDRFVLFDDAQYMKGGWINRNRVLKPGGGPQYITMPVAKHAVRTPIKDVRAKEGFDWKALVLRQIEHYKKRAPFFGDVCGLLAGCFELDDRSVANLNGHYLSAIFEYLGLDFRVERSSAMNFDYSRVVDVDDWTLTISEQLGASEYVNPIGGAELFDKRKFAARNLTLTFLQPHLREYDQRGDRFEPSLSIIDVLMFNDRETVRSMLGEGVLVPA